MSPYGKEIYNNEGCNDTARKLHKPAWHEFMAGYLAGNVNILITFPVNKTMFRQQLHGIGAMQAVRQLQVEGLMSLYRGILPPLLQKSFSYSLMFGCYDHYRRTFHNSGLGPSTSVILSAILAGCAEAVLTPFERVQTLMLDSNYKHKFKNTPHAFSALREHGIKEYYRGLSAILMRNGPSNVIFFSCRDKLRALVPEHPKLGLLADFISGACLGALISTLTFPINTTKTHMQKTCGGEFSSFRRVFLQIYRERGMRGMFSGVHVNYTRSFISWGIINVTYEYFSKQFKRWQLNGSAWTFYAAKPRESRLTAEYVWRIYIYVDMQIWIWFLHKVKKRLFVVVEIVVFLSVWILSQKPPWQNTIIVVSLFCFRDFKLDPNSHL